MLHAEPARDAVADESAVAHSGVALRTQKCKGLIGLRRAFQMAAARTVVSALWPVSDEVTTEMMSSLYARKDESLQDAMRRVQLEKIRALRSERSVDHPFTWGAFIALGDWR